MKDSIRLHPKNGLNPTLTVCRWCGQDTGEIALLGAAYRGDEPAPMRMAVNDIPCQSCQGMMRQGITLIEVKSEPMHGEQPERTGTWCVIKEESLRRLINPEHVEEFVKAKRAYMVPAMWDELGLPRENVAPES